MDDQKIIKLLWQRAESAIEALAKKFGNRLMSIAMNILGVHQDAEESVNDTYLAVWNTIPPKKPDPLAGYVYATGRNISLDRLKYITAEKRDCRYDVPIDELANCIPAPALEETVEARELGLAIAIVEIYRAIRAGYGDVIGVISIRDCARSTSSNLLYRLIHAYVKIGKRKSAKALLVARRVLILVLVARDNGQ